MQYYSTGDYIAKPTAKLRRLISRPTYTTHSPLEYLTAPQFAVGSVISTTRTALAAVVDYWRATDSSGRYHRLFLTCPTVFPADSC